MQGPQDTTLYTLPLQRLRERITFGHVAKHHTYPDLLGIQINSFQEFIQENVKPEDRREIGLQRAFLSNFPIEDNAGVYELNFVDYFVEKPKYTEEECRERELTYAKTLKARLRLSSKADPTSEDHIEAIDQEVYLGQIPIMTQRGTFIINGAERVVVAQLHRSPGCFFDEALHPNGTKIFSARIIPFKGSWIEFTTDIHDVMYAYIDRKKKFPVTTLLRALGYSSDEDLLNLFELTEDVPTSELTEDYLGRRVAADTVDMGTGEIVAPRDTIVSPEFLKLLENTSVDSLKLYKYDNPNDEPIIAKTLAKDLTRTREDALESIYRQLRSSDPPDLDTAWGLLEKLFFNSKRYDLGVVGRFRINEKLGMNVPLDVTTLTVDDIVNIIKYLIEVRDSKQPVDDIDHLANRRVRTVGEQLESTFNLGLTRMARTIKERLSVRDSENITPSELVNARTITSVINQFFGTNQLSQFMDQTNPLSEITHKRRTSALGPGGLTRERAGFEVRDVHYTHYGRLCPIETPEGPNIGLISSLAIHARVNKFGFIETPYVKVENGALTDELEFMPADREEDLIIVPAGTELDEKGRIVGDTVKARVSGDYRVVPTTDVQFMEVSTDQITSPAASLIPFLENDDANRALMGSNMQRQGVPLLRPKAPIVGTGMEARVARDSRALLLAEDDGVVEYVCGDYIQVRYDDNRTREERLVSFDNDRVVRYDLFKFYRTNQDTAINQRPIVKAGQRVRKGEPLIDGASTEMGELALGRNVMVAFMPWRGYNFEDAIVISERMVAEDVFTSVHIEEFTLQVRDTKRGEEEFTREIPNVSEEATKDLDDRGIVRIGAKVKESDILIGKITPKGETDPTPEEKLLRAIFGDKAGDVKDVSLKAPPGLKGTVINTKLFARRVLSSDSEFRLEEKKRQDLITKREQQALRALDIDCVERIGELLQDQTSLGIHTANETVVFRSGTKLSAKDLVAKYEEGVFVPSAMNIAQDWVADSKVMKLLRILLDNYETRRQQIMLDGRIERNKIAAGDELQPGILQMSKVYVAKKRKLQVGDKMAGRHGNKGIVSKIVPVQDMPFLPDGTPVDIVLNPLGVPSRMNIGQLYETALGWAASKLNVHFATPIFDGATWEEVGEYLEKAGLPSTGKTILYDGRTGEPFENEVTVGIIYMMKLSHLVEDKLHARSIDPYSLITQQPLGGKAQFGGQRLGEMEVWALEAYGAAHTLQEMLTVKSDDVLGRAKMYEALVKGENLPVPNIPESFNVLVRELQGLCLDVKID